MSVSYRLPFPLSVNNLFRTLPNGLRVKTGKYKAWMKVASDAVKSQGVVSIGGPVSVTVLVVRPDRRKRDLDNLLKAVLDTLVLLGVIEDDSVIERILIEWHSDNLGGCLVEIREHEREKSIHDR